MHLLSRHQAVGPGERPALALERSHVVRLVGEDPVVLGDRGVQLVGEAQRLGEAEARLDVARVAREQGVVHGSGGIQARGPSDHLRMPAPSRAVVGRDREQLVVARVPAGPGLEERSRLECAQMPRMLVEQRFQVGDRAVGLSRPGPHASPVDARVGVGRLEPQEPLEQLLRPPVVLRPSAHERETMERRGVVRHELQHAP
jgi:hypothetical protein